MPLFGPLIIGFIMISHLDYFPSGIVSSFFLKQCLVAQSIDQEMRGTTLELILFSWHIMNKKYCTRLLCKFSETNLLGLQGAR